MLTSFWPFRSICLHYIISHPRRKSTMGARLYLGSWAVTSTVTLRDVRKLDGCSLSVLMTTYNNFKVWVFFVEVLHKILIKVELEVLTYHCVYFLNSGFKDCFIYFTYMNFILNTACATLFLTILNRRTIWMPDILNFSASFFLISHCLWVAQGSTMYRRISSMCNESIWTDQGIFFIFASRFPILCTHCLN